MDGRDFCRKWLVIAGKPPSAAAVYHVQIEEQTAPEETAFRITYWCNGHRRPFEQTLYFDEETHTLGSRPDDGKPQRCVALWRRPRGAKSCIFAMWIAKGSDEAGMPWEVGDNGSWGAEGG